jgi:hypothetical protein
MKRSVPLAPRRLGLEGRADGSKDGPAGREAGKAYSITSVEPGGGLPGRV